jgi:hypothetical protein
VCVCWTIAIGVCRGVAAQGLSDSVTTKPDIVQPATGGVPYLEGDSATMVAAELKSRQPDFLRVLKAYYGAKLFQGELLDWVVFIDGTTSPATLRTALVTDGKVWSGDATPPTVRGKKFAWVVVLSNVRLSTTSAGSGAGDPALEKLLARVDTVLCRQRAFGCQLPIGDLVHSLGSVKDTTGALPVKSMVAGLAHDPDEGADLTISRRVVDFQRNTTLGGALSSLTRIGSTFTAQAALADSTVGMKLYVVTRHVTDTLFGVQQRLGLHQDASIVLSLAMNTNRAVKTEDRAVYLRFTNSDPSWVALGVGPGLTLNAPDTIFATGAAADVAPKSRPTINLYGTVWLQRPAYPTSPFGFGVTVGTNLVNGDIFKDVVVAAYFANILGPVGALVGTDVVARRTSTGTGTRQYRRAKPFIGAQFPL